MLEVGASKGSFYWHFKDVPAYKSQLLDYWERQATLPPIATLAAPMERLLALASSGERSKSIVRQVDPAIRAWAREYPLAAETLARVDQYRISQLSDILAELNLTNPDFPRAIYATMIGLNALSTGDRVQNNSALTSVLASIVALAES